MKKIDLHLHTIKSISDNDFILSMEKLKEYVSKQNIDCIAITNHNLFDLQQYKEIKDYLDIVVFPGIEIDLENGHLLLISDIIELSDFESKCKLVQSKIRNRGDYILLNELKEIFPDLSKYILIPHYEKDPKIPKVIIEELKAFITAGEVTSPKKFKSCYKNKESLVPVIFSDSRIIEETYDFPTKQTYINIEEITFKGLKVCLSDRTKIALSKNGGNKFFDGTSDGLLLSTGLNVVLGERSSGKSFTLDRIAKDNENVKYIKQFSLLQRDNETDEITFKSKLSNEQSKVNENYLKGFKKVVEDVSEIDLKSDGNKIDRYLSSLKTYASEIETADIYSKATLYSESKFSENSLEVIEKLISSTKTLLNNKEYKLIINKHIEEKTLKSLLIELIKKFEEEKTENSKRMWVNDLIENIQSELKRKSAQQQIEDVDFETTISNIKTVEKFEIIAEKIKEEKQIFEKEVGKYKIVAATKKYTSASELKNKSGKKIKFSDAFRKYDESYNFLNELKEIDGLATADYYKYFIDVEYKILNKEGFEVSGGERSEYNLLNEISNALDYDILLIDEPESSFDNQFLKSEVNTIIKDISEKIPVVLVTHNSTVGASIKPDFIHYTKKEIIGGEVIYKIYSGHPADKELKNIDGENTNNYMMLMNCLEAGEDTYEERKSVIYEILKD